jgi:hypothetical protein
MLWQTFTVAQRYVHPNNHDNVKEEVYIIVIADFTFSDQPTMDFYIP